MHLLHSVLLPTFILLTGFLAPRAFATKSVRAVASPVAFHYQVGLSAYDVTVSVNEIELVRTGGSESFLVRKESCFAPDFEELRSLIERRVRQRQPAKLLSRQEALLFPTEASGHFLFEMGDNHEAIRSQSSFGLFLLRLMPMMETAEGRMRVKCDARK
jgi:hypothetical protein